MYKALMLTLSLVSAPLLAEDTQPAPQREQEQESPAAQDDTAPVPDAPPTELKTWRRASP